MRDQTDAQRKHFLAEYALLLTERTRKNAERTQHNADIDRDLDRDLDRDRDLDNNVYFVSAIRKCEQLMKAETFIPYKFPGLNDYIRECRANKYKAAQIKSETETVCYFFMKNLPHFSKPVKVSFEWHEENKRRDLDNIAFAKKFVLDALVRHEVLDGDSQRHVIGFSDSFVIGNEYGVRVKIEEAL